MWNVNIMESCMADEYAHKYVYANDRRRHMTKVDATKDLTSKRRDFDFMPNIKCHDADDQVVSIV